MITPPVACASRSATADLPLAVGPAISATIGLEGFSMLIATLIAAERLSGGDISAASDALAAKGAGVMPHEWVEQGIAADLLFERLDRAGARAVLEGLLPDVDVVVQPVEHRRK